MLWSPAAHPPLILLHPFHQVFIRGTLDSLALVDLGTSAIFFSFIISLLALYAYCNSASRNLVERLPLLAIETIQDTQERLLIAQYLDKWAPLEARKGLSLLGRAHGSGRLSFWQHTRAT